MEKSARPEPSSREAYRWFTGITTRWMDNDVYGHINNVVYYSFFDTAVNTFLIERGLLRIGESDTIGLVVETSCRFMAPLAFPGAVEAGLRVTKVGTSSVSFEIGLFAAGHDAAAAEGTFTHVYVDATTRRPKPISNSAIEQFNTILRS